MKLAAIVVAGLLLAALIGAGSGVAGLYLSYHAGIAAAAAVVLVATAVFALAFLFAPRTGAVTARVARRLHFPHPERDVRPAEPRDGV